MFERRSAALAGAHGPRPNCAPSPRSSRGEGRGEGPPHGTRKWSDLYPKTRIASPLRAAGRSPLTTCGNRATNACRLVAPSCPGLSRASTSYPGRRTTWMAGTSPATTMWKQRGTRGRMFLYDCPAVYWMPACACTTAEGVAGRLPLIVHQATSSRSSSRGNANGCGCCCDYANGSAYARARGRPPHRSASARRGRGGRHVRR